MNSKLQEKLSQTVLKINTEQKYMYKENTQNLFKVKL